MKSRQHPDFVDAFKRLDALRQKRARKAFEQWKTDPAIRGLGWHVLKGMLAPIYSMHVGLYDRAVALVTKDTDGKPAATWLWIGSHEEYNVWIERNRPRHLITWTDSKAWSKVASMDDVAANLNQRQSLAVSPDPAVAPEPTAPGNPWAGKRQRCKAR